MATRRRWLALVPLAAFACAQDRTVLQSSFARSANLPKGKVERIAVLDFAGPSGAAFSDLLSLEFLQQGYAAVERSRIYAVIDQREIAAATNQDLRVREQRESLEGILRARVLLIGAVAEAGADYELSSGRDSVVATGASSLLVTCRAVDPRTGEVLWTGIVKAGAHLANGDHASVLSGWRAAAQSLVHAYAEATDTGESVILEGDRIPSR